MNRNTIKRWIGLLLAALTLCLPGTALGDGAYSLYQAKGGFSSLAPIPGTPYLLATRTGNRNYGLANETGRLICPCQFPYLAYLRFDYLQAAQRAVKSDLGLLTARAKNRLALVALDGTLVTDYAYGNFEVFSAYWAAAWVLDQARETDYDLKLDGTHFYKIKRCDLYYLGRPDGKEPRLIRSFSREEYAKGAAHGQYFSVQSRGNEVTVFNPEGEAAAVEHKKATEPVYKLRNLAIVDGITGEYIAGGYSGVWEATGANGFLLVGTRKDYTGTKTSAILDTDGNVWMPATDAAVVSVSGDYVLLKKNGLFGLYSLRERRELLPCAYDAILKNRNAVDPYLTQGYLGAVKNGRYQIISAETGKTVRAFTCRKEWAMLGLLNYRQTDTELEFSSPVNGFCSAFPGALLDIQGSGYLLCLRTGGQYYVVNWQGENLAPPSGDPFTVVSDETVIGYENNEYVLYRLMKIK